MSKVVRSDVDSLNTVLAVTVEKSDYEPKFLSELKKYKNQAQIKGFRKGKTPISVLKKMFGKGVLSEIVNDQFQETLFNYIKDEKLNVLGQPLLTDEQEPLEFDLKELEDYELKFELGLAPDFEIAGLGKTESITRYKIEIEDDVIEKDLSNARSRLGTYEHPEDGIEEGDSLKLEIKELDESGAIKEDGLVSDFVLLVTDVREEFKADMLARKQGDTFRVNLMTIEKHERDEEKQLEFIRTYYLRLPQGDETVFNPEFEATIQEVSRLKEAELDETFFKGMFGEDTEVADEEGAKEMIRKDYDEIYAKQIDSLVYKSILDRVLELNEIPLPDAFLKKWLVTNNGEKIKERFDTEYDKFAQQTRRSILYTRLKDQFEIEASEEDIRAKATENARQMVFQYLGGNESFLPQLVERSLQNQEQVEGFYEQVVTDKMIVKLKEEIVEMEEVISLDDFQKMMETISNNVDDERPQWQLEEEE